jgi:Clathrin adaptor complex small chain
MATSMKCLFVQSSVRLCVQVYLILDEFILGGEIQESSKRVILERLAGGGCL